MANLDRTQSRIVPQHKTEAQWSDWLKETGNQDFCPKSGEIIIFDPDDNYNYSRFKVGRQKFDANGQPLRDENNNLIYYNLSELEFSSGVEIKNGITILNTPLDIVNENENIIMSINDNIVDIENSINIGSGAEAIASDSVAIGISRCGNVKSENQSSLAIGGDVVAAGKYSIASGCETLTGVPLAEQKQFIVDLIRKHTSGILNLMTSNNNNTSWVITPTEDMNLERTFNIFSYIPQTEDYNEPSYNVTVTLATLKAGKEYYLPNLLQQPNITTDEQSAWKRLTDKEFFNLTLQDNFTLLNTNLGNNTFATGFRCAAIGQSSAAIGGQGSKALADYSVAMGGRDCVVNAPYSAGIGIGVTGLTVNEPNTVKIGNNNFNFRLNSSGTVIIGPNTLSSNLANTFLIGPDNKNYLRINSSGFTFTGNINVPDDFIENIWS